MKVKYIGPHKQVEIAATGDVVEKGSMVDVPQELAESLCTQTDNWEAVAPRSGTQKKESN